MADTVLYELTDGLATITLNRPDAMNALNLDIKVALRDALLQAAEDPAVRAVLLTGSGRAFCVGQDLKEHIGLLAADREAHARGEATEGSTMTTVALHYNPIVTTIAGMPKPVVAAVNGVAAGAGAGFAMAADYRIVADSASFNTSFVGVALTGDSGISWTLQRLVGHGRAADLMLFPRNVSAAEALELGIANRVVPAAELAAEATAVARALAQGPTAAYAAVKESLAYAAGHTLTDALAKEDELQRRLGSSDDHLTAVDAFVKKEKPRFTGR
ncbi:enoyl-CoA hydratase-related protein [Streptomyces sp. HD1123-B1]|uniref:2-cyclohexenylcarbonyl CoA isomerase n=1 Tax=Streptomyces TaxID=1883 RepID=UPI003D741134